MTTNLLILLSDQVEDLLLDITDLSKQKVSAKLVLFAFKFTLKIPVNKKYTLLTFNPHHLEVYLRLDMALGELS